MKKDSELPWAVRLTRWAAVLFGIALALGYTVHRYMEWFI